MQLTLACLFILLFVPYCLSLDSRCTKYIPIPRIGCRGHHPYVIVSFNQQTGKCSSRGFCLDGRSSFKSLEECQKLCESDYYYDDPVEEIKRPDYCLLPKEKGRCRAIKPRFFYNNENGQCENFDYGGCGGNENNFHTLEDCKSKCNVN